MVDVSTLRLEVESDAAKKGKRNLDDLSGSAHKADDRVDRLGKTSVATNAKMQTMNAGVMKLAKGLGVLAAGFASLASGRAAIMMARDFNAAQAEASTLIAGTTAEMAMLEAESRKLTAAYGGTATQQVQAFYQAISAGADGVAGAAALLDVANKLAIGGVTDVTTATDGLTTATNAYAAVGLTAQQASDALFVGMKGGKTTIGQLSGALGQIVPIASAAGVSFDEVVAGVSALTTQGLSTSMATTGLRQVIASIVKPTKEAADAAKLLGIEFDVTSLKSKGLQGFLDDVIDKTDGSTDSLAQLFGSVEALGAVLAFTGGGGEKFAEIMAQMGIKAGASQEAFEKIAASLDFRLSAAMGKFSNVMLSVGQILLAGFVPVIELVANNLQLIGSISAAAGALLFATYVPAMVAATASTGAWILSLITLKGALLATGIGALVVGAGLLINATVNLVKATGSWGTAMVLLGDLASGVFSGIIASAAAIVPALGIVWKTVAAGFFAMIREVQKAWASFLHNMTAGARIAGLDDMALALSGFAIRAGSAVHEMTGTINDQATAVERLKTEMAAMQEFGWEKARIAMSNLLKVMAASNEEMGDGSENAKKLAALLKSLETTSTGAGSGLDELSKGAKKAKDAVSDLEKEFDTKFKNSIGSVSDAWGDFVVGGLKDFDSFADAIKNTFKQLLADMIALAAKNQILISLGLSSSGGGGVGGILNSVAGGGGGGGLLGGGGGILGNIGSILGVGGGGLAGLAGMGGIGGVVGGIASGLGGVLSGGGLASSFANLGGLVTGVSSGLGAIGAAIPAFGIAIAAASFLFKAFSRKYAGSGIEGVFTEAMGFQGNEFDFFKGGFFRSDKTVRRSVDQELQDALNTTFAGITTGLRDMSDVIGISSDAIDGFRGSAFKFFTNGKSAEEIQEKLTAIMTQNAEAMADLILTQDEYIRSGESALEALERLSSSLMNVNDMFDLIGLSAFQASLAAADMASSLVDAFGGIDQLNAASSTYFANFFSDTEQLETLTRRLSETFAALGVIMPETRSGFRDLIEGIDITTEEGQTLFAQLMQLSGSFAQITPQVGALTLAMQGMVGGITDEINRLLQSSRLMSNLRTFVSGLLGTNLSAASASQNLPAQQNAFDQALTAARGGDQAAIRSLPAIARTLLGAAEGQSGSGAEFRAFSGMVQSQLLGVAGAAPSDAQTVALEQLLAFLQEGDLTGVGSVDDLLSGFNGGTSALVGSMEILSDMLSDLVNEIAGGQSAIPAFAHGGSHSGGVRLVGENGPELEFTGPSTILSNRITQAAMSPSTVSSRSTDQDRLLQEVSRMRDEQAQIGIQVVVNTKKMASIMKKWDIDGQPPERVA